MREHLYGFLGVIIIITLLVAVSYGGYQLERWWNWEWGYSSKVQEEIEPLRKEIADLRLRVETLENKER